MSQHKHPQIGSAGMSRRSFVEAGAISLAAVAFIDSGFAAEARPDTKSVSELKAGIAGQIGKAVEVRGHLAYAGETTLRYTGIQVTETGSEITFPAERVVHSYRLHTEPRADSPFVELIPADAEVFSRFRDGRIGEFARFPVQVSAEVFDHRGLPMLQAKAVRPAR